MLEAARHSGEPAMRARAKLMFPSVTKVNAIANCTTNKAKIHPKLLFIRHMFIYAISSQFLTHHHDENYIPLLDKLA
jgi:hypothetical protein